MKGMKQEMGKGGNLHAGMTRKNPSGDSGMRPPAGNVADEATRTTVGKGHSIGGREA